MCTSTHNRGRSYFRPAANWDIDDSCTVLKQEPPAANDTVAGVRVYFGPDQIGDDNTCERKIWGLPRIPPFVLPLDVQYTHLVQASVRWWDWRDLNALKGDWDDARLRDAYRRRQSSVQWCVSVHVWLFLFLGGVRYLLVIQAEDVMHELVLLARLDHPTPAKTAIKISHIRLL